MVRMTSKNWYFVAGVLVLAGIAIAVVGFGRLVSKVEGLQRVGMPGKAEIVLPAGETTLYAEQRSIVDGKTYETAEGVEFRCGVRDPAGKEIALERPSSTVSYGFASYAGRNTFDLRVETAGTYVLLCDAPSQFAMAIGSGVGTLIVIAVVGGLVPVLLGVLTFFIVLVKRRRQKRAAHRAQATAPS